MSTTRYAETTVAVAGGDLHLGHWSGDGTPVVALHGITSHHRSWPVIARHLPGVAIWAPDLRGRGRSRDLPGPWGMAAHADDAAAVIQAAGAPAVVVGHSMGGFVAVTLAARFPDLVKALVLVDGGLPFAPAELESTRAGLALIRQRLEARFASADEYAALFGQHPAFAADQSPELGDYARYDTVETTGGVRAAAQLDAVLADQTDLLDGTDRLEALSRLGADGAPPAVFLHAPRGFVDDPPGLYAAATVEALGGRFPGVRTRLVEAVNHYTIVLADRGAEAVADEVRAAR